jgi:hypothetical protein
MLKQVQQDVQHELMQSPYMVVILNLFRDLFSKIDAFSIVSDRVFTKRCAKASSWRHDPGHNKIDAETSSTGRYD